MMIGFLKGISSLLMSLENTTGVAFFGDIRGNVDRLLGAKLEVEAKISQHKSNVNDLAKSAKGVSSKKSA